MLCNDGTSAVRRSAPEPEPVPVVEEPLASAVPAIPVVDELDDDLEADEDELPLDDDELLEADEL